jgi:hypothetical protein
MKYLILIGLVSITSRSYSQQYHLMVDTDAIWYYEYSLGNWFDGVQSTVVRFSVGGDTLITTESYRKLFKREVATAQFYPSFNAWFYGGESMDSTLIGGLREDSLGSVWFYSLVQEYAPFFQLIPDSLYRLFDYSAVVGDTLFWYSDNSSVYVWNIDSVQLENGELRERHALSNGDEWIAGIGSSKAMLGGSCSLDCLATIKCRFNADSLLFKSQDYYSTDCANSILDDETILSKEVLTIFPNPTADHINIRYRLQSNPRAQLHFTDILGRTLYSTGIISGQTLTIPIALFNTKGVVLCQLKTNQGVTVRKLLIE